MRIYKGKLKLQLYLQAGFDHGGNSTSEAILDRYDNVTMVATGASFYRNCFPPGSVFTPTPTLSSFFLLHARAHLACIPLSAKKPRQAVSVCEAVLVCISAPA